MLLHTGGRGQGPSGGMELEKHRDGPVNRGSPTLGSLLTRCVDMEINYGPLSLDFGNCGYLTLLERLLVHLLSLQNKMRF